MPSRIRSTRQAQVRRCQEEIRKRLADLKERGAEKAVVQKDPKLRQMRARLRQLQKALLAILAIDKKNESLAVRKQERAARKLLEKNQPKASKKKAEAAEAEKKSKKDKKEKKEKKKKEEPPVEAAAPAEKAPAEKAPEPA